MMDRTRQLLKQETFESGIVAILEHLTQESERINTVIQPYLISCSEKDQSVTFAFPVLPWQLNPFDMMHGGCIATAFDVGMGIFAYYLCDGKATVTANLSVSYLKPVPMDDVIHITAKMASRGRTLISITGECHLVSTGRLTSTAMATFAVVR